MPSDLSWSSSVGVGIAFKVIFCTFGLAKCWPFMFFLYYFPRLLKQIIVFVRWIRFVRHYIGVLGVVVVVPAVVVQETECWFVFEMIFE